MCAAHRKRSRATFSLAAVDNALTADVVRVVETAAGARFTHHETSMPEIWDAVFPLNHFLDVYEMSAPEPTFALETEALFGNVPLQAPTLTLDKVRPRRRPCGPRALLPRS